MDFVIRKGTSYPVSAQIALAIEKAVRAGEYAPGDRLPSLRSLARRLGVAFNTVLRAYDDLARAGFVYTIPARGTFVAHHEPPPSPADPAEVVRERGRWERIADAFVVQTERCGLGLDDALSRVRLRARERRARIEGELVERAAKRERREAALAAEARMRAEARDAR